MAKVACWKVCVLMVIFVMNNGLVVSDLQPTLLSGGSSVTASLNSFVDFMWEIKGKPRLVQWGTRMESVNDIKENLINIDASGSDTYNVSLYNGRVNGSWTGNSTVVRVTFTLTSLKEIDNRIFLFIFSPQSFIGRDIYKTVQLIVQDPTEATILTPSVSTSGGATASFTCTATGLPAPNITWMRNVGSAGNEVVSSSAKVQVNSSLGFSRLTILNTSSSDHGYYICQASNYFTDLARAFLGIVFLQEDHDLCPTSFSATMGQSIIICCPVRGFPPPEVHWELPNGTLLKTRNTNLRITIKSKDDYGRYSCIAKGVEKASLKANVTVFEKEADINSTSRRIVLKPGSKFEWQKVPGVHNYLIRLSHANSLRATSFVSDDTDNSMEIPFSSLVSNSNTGKLPRYVTVAIEVLAIDKASVIGKQNYTNVEIHASATISTVSLMAFLLGLCFTTYNKTPLCLVE